MNAQSEISVGAYYAGWMQGWYNNGRLPAENIDFNAVDYVIHFALFPKSDGTFDDQSNSIIESNSAALVNAAHSAGKKVLISIGGWNSDTGFRGATSSINLATFIANLVNFITVRGYDGIDIDWEPLHESDAAQYIAFITALRLAMNVIQPRPMLTAANGREGYIFAQIHQHFDQINLMTYDMSGPWNGWVTWHNAPVYDGGYQFPGGGYVPSADGLVKDFIDAGVPANKIGIGIDFYGYIWRGGGGTPTGGVTEPRQSWTNYPEVFPNKPYYEIIDNYYRPDLYRWDSSAAASYLSIDTNCDWNDMFITFDDERTTKAKVEYAQKKNLAGVFIWELGGGVLSDSGTQPLLNSIKYAVNDSVTSPATPQLYLPSNQSYGLLDSVSLSWFQIENAESYRLQLASDPDFNSILIDTIISTATSAVIQNLPNSQNFYWRVSAINISGSSNFTPSRTFVTAHGLLESPHVISPGDSSYKVPINLRFSWNQVPNAGAYNLQIANTPDICDVILDTIIVNDTSFVINGLEYSRDYYWHIKSFPDESGSYAASSYSDWYMFTTIASPPAMPFLSSPADDAKKISIHPVLRWQHSDYTEYYEIRIATNEAFTDNLIDSSGITGTSIKLHNLFHNTVYYWSVKAYNEVGESSWSDVRQFTTGEIWDDLSQIDGESNSFELYQNYPNPFNAETIIRFSLAEESTVHILVTDILGNNKKILNDMPLSTGIYEIKFDGINMSSGVYFFTVSAYSVEGNATTENFIQTKKMMMIK